MACFERLALQTVAKMHLPWISGFWWSPLFSNCRVSGEIYRCPQICVFSLFHSCFYFSFEASLQGILVVGASFCCHRQTFKRNFDGLDQKTNGTQAKPQSTSASVTYWSAVIAETLCCSRESMSCWRRVAHACCFQVNMSSWPCTSTSRGKWASSWFRHTSPVSWRWFWPRSPSGLIRNLFRLGLCSVSKPSF